MFVGINRKHNFSQILSIIIMAVVARRTFVSQFPGVNVCNITPAGCKVAPVVLLQPTDLGISTDSGIRTKREKIIILTVVGIKDPGCQGNTTDNSIPHVRYNQFKIKIVLLCKVHYPVVLFLGNFVIIVLVVYLRFKYQVGG